MSQLTSNLHAIDTSPAKFGALRDSSEIAFDAPALRERMETDGYLFLPGLLNRADVLDARRVVAEQLMGAGLLQIGTDPGACLAAEDAKTVFHPEWTRTNAPLQKVLYDGAMIEFYERFIGENVRHFDFTWLRTVAPGKGTPPHTDAVYMNRGTQNLYTSWVPLGDVSLEMGGLMMLENSHLHRKLRHVHSAKDVDAFCENQPKVGGGARTSGALSKNPVTLRDAIGGRWLTAEFRAGDLLLFSIYTVHASLDNHSKQIRLSSDSRYQSASEPADERWIGANPIAHGPAGKRAMIC